MVCRRIYESQGTSDFIFRRPSVSVVKVKGIRGDGLKVLRTEKKKTRDFSSETGDDVPGVGTKGGDPRPRVTRERELESSGGRLKVEKGRPKVRARSGTTKRKELGLVNRSRGDYPVK